MTARLASAAASRGAPIELRVEDRLQSLSQPVREASALMLAVLAGSMAVHALLVATAFITARVTPPVAPHEISVEVIEEPAKEAPKPQPREAPKPVAKAAPSKPEAPPPAAKPIEPPKAAEPAKPPAPAPKPVAPAEATAPATPAQVKPAQPPIAKPAQPSAASPSQAVDTKALEDELAGLRAEQAALKAEQDQDPAGRAIAMPSIGAGDDGDAVGYQQLVFSQLAKAKGDDHYEGKSGVAGIRFEMDKSGQLVGAQVVSSSGDPALDARALDIIHRAAPFPPPPTDADRYVFANVNFIAPKRP